MDTIRIRPVAASDREWVEKLIVREWMSTMMVSRGKVVNVLELPGFIAEVESEHAGLVTYLMSNNECEVMSLNSLRSGIGIGSALLKAVEDCAREEGCQRLWLITTNDNIEALRFYQRRGFELVAVHRGALEESRRLKPQIPLTGRHGISLRDEIELEIVL